MLDHLGKVDCDSKRTSSGRTLDSGVASRCGMVMAWGPAEMTGVCAAWRPRLIFSRYFIWSRS
eukprot:260288-Pyramimonas_sp.AAC.1